MVLLIIKKQYSNYLAFQPRKMMMADGEWMMANYSNYAKHKNERNNKDTTKNNNSENMRSYACLYTSCTLQKMYDFCFLYLKKSSAKDIWSVPPSGACSDPSDKSVGFFWSMQGKRIGTPTMGLQRPLWWYHVYNPHNQPLSVEIEECPKSAADYFHRWQSVPIAWKMRGHVMIGQCLPHSIPSFAKQSTEQLT